VASDIKVLSQDMKTVREGLSTTHATTKMSPPGVMLLTIH